MKFKKVLATLLTGVVLASSPLGLTGKGVSEVFAVEDLSPEVQAKLSTATSKVEIFEITKLLIDKDLAEIAIEELEELGGTAVESQVDELRGRVRIVEINYTDAVASQIVAYPMFNRQPVTKVQLEEVALKLPIVGDAREKQELEKYFVEFAINYNTPFVYDYGIALDTLTANYSSINYGAYLASLNDAYLSQTYFVGPATSYYADMTALKTAVDNVKNEAASLEALSGGFYAHQLSTYTALANMIPLASVKDYYKTTEYNRLLNLAKSDNPEADIIAKVYVNFNQANYDAAVASVAKIADATIKVAETEKLNKLMADKNAASSAINGLTVSSTTTEIANVQLLVDKVAVGDFKTALQNSLNEKKGLGDYTKQLERAEELVRRAERTKLREDYDDAMSDIRKLKSADYDRLLERLRKIDVIKASSSAASETPKISQSTIDSRIDKIERAIRYLPSGAKRDIENLLDDLEETDNKADYYNILAQIYQILAKNTDTRSSGSDFAEELYDKVERIAEY